MMKGVYALIASAAFLHLMTNPALTDESARPQAPGPDRSLLSTWDKPAFSPPSYTEQAPWLGSRPAKGEHVDFLSSPNFQKLGPILANKGNWPTYLEGATQVE
jgi:hypothetical protein